ncbi:MAG TPA: hypothetical protein VMN56_10880 [Casimicrobiaceae bacterium]|nr:hypothetical protein [Casimicrobiaceae bacterium]
MSTTRIARIFVAAAAVGLGACAQQIQDMEAGQQVRLRGSNEVPPADMHSAKYPGGDVRAQLAGRP